LGYRKIKFSPTPVENEMDLNEKAKEAPTAILAIFSTCGWSRERGRKAAGQRLRK
jgi:hypothetical protein